MDLSEFKRLLGADPANRDPAFLEARQSSAEFIAAARAADQLERRIECAAKLPVPASLIEDLQKLSGTRSGRRVHWPGLALAASVLLAVVVATLSWQSAPRWDSVERYLAEHYDHDGALLLQRAADGEAAEVNAALARFDVSLAPELVAQVRLVRYCPTPDGRGVHLVLNTGHGMITLFFMPDTAVEDGRMVEFDGMHAQLVTLSRGSAAIIGTHSQPVGALHDAVQDGFLFGDRGA